MSEDTFQEPRVDQLVDGTVIDLETAQGQKTEPTAKLFENQVLETEIVRDFGRASDRDSDH